jgi:hypothetical protein
LAHSQQEQETTIAINRGLFLLRYAAGAANGRSPFAVVRPASASAPFIEVFSAPGVVAGFLSSPGDCAVIRAEQSGSLVVKMVAQSDGDPLDGVLKIEPLTGFDPGGGPDVAPAPIAANSGALTFLAHVSRLGDVKAAAGAWIAGPDAPAPIEGLEVRGALPDGVSLDIQPLLATNPPRWLDWSGPGNFVGTRALPLAGLRMRLTGSSSENFEIAANALFLGSAVMSRRGREIEIVSTAGGDPLVGLRIELAVAPLAAVAMNATAPAARPPEQKLKVFRAMANA